jgi:CubicO group peptidase (beta-lactamase class C family)
MWGGVYGHSWFVDPAAGTSYVLMTNTSTEGMSGQLSLDLMAAALGA